MAFAPSCAPVALGLCSSAAASVGIARSWVARRTYALHALPGLLTDAEAIELDLVDEPSAARAARIRPMPAGSECVARVGTQPVGSNARHGLAAPPPASYSP